VVDDRLLIATHAGDEEKDGCDAKQHDGRKQALTAMLEGQIKLHTSWIMVSRLMLGMHK